MVSSPSPVRPNWVKNPLPARAVFASSLSLSFSSSSSPSSSSSRLPSSSLSSLLCLSSPSMPPSPFSPSSSAFSFPGDRGAEELRVRLARGAKRPTGAGDGIARRGEHHRRTVASVAVAARGTRRGARARGGALGEDVRRKNTPRYSTNRRVFVLVLVPRLRHGWFGF